MKYIIGVDGGGTKTEAIAYNLNGEELGKAKFGFGNLLIGFNEGYKNIESSIEKCMQYVKDSYKDANCVFIYLGLAGIEAGDLNIRIEGLLKEKFQVNIKAVNDAEIALAAMLKGRDGILTIAGTGSISYGIHNNKSGRCGGWGHILGDQGSGYYIAIEGFKNMTVEEDMGLSQSLLTKSFMKQLNIHKIDEIKSFIYSWSKGDIAAFAPLVVKQAELGDKVSEDILIQAGKHLALMTKRLYEKLTFNDNTLIGIKGSILTEVKLVRESFEATLKQNIKDINIIAEKTSSAKGAFYLAKKLIQIS